MEDRKEARSMRLILARCLSEIRWRAFPYARRLYSVGPYTSISTRAIVRDPRLVRLGAKVKIGFGAELWTFAGHPHGGPFSIVCGEGADIRPYALLHTYGGYIEIGDHSVVNSFCFINGSGGVTIGDEVMMGTNTSILSAEHGIAPGEIPMTRQPCLDMPVVIEDNVYLGAGVTVLAGVRIGTGAVVGAGAVVREDVPPNAVVAGVPARIVRYRELEPSGSVYGHERKHG